MAIAAEKLPDVLQDMNIPGNSISVYRALKNARKVLIEGADYGEEGSDLHSRWCAALDDLELMMQKVAQGKMFTLIQL